MSVTSGGTAPNGCRIGGRSAASAGSAGIVDHLGDRELAVAVAVPEPDRGGQVLDADHHADEAVLLGRVVRRAQLEHHLVLVAEVDGLQVPALAQVQEVQRVAVLAAEQQLADQPVLDHRGGAPLAGDQHVAGQVPPEVVGRGTAARGRSPSAPSTSNESWSSSAIAARPVGAVGAAQRWRRRSPRGHSARCAAGSSRPAWPAPPARWSGRSSARRGSSLVSST